MARKPATVEKEAVTKQERVYGVLRERIQSGEYEPGHRMVINQLSSRRNPSTRRLP